MTPHVGLNFGPENVIYLFAHTNFITLFDKPGLGYRFSFEAQDSDVMVHGIYTKHTHADKQHFACLDCLCCFNTVHGLSTASYSSIYDICSTQSRHKRSLVQTLCQLCNKRLHNIHGIVQNHTRNASTQPAVRYRHAKQLLSPSICDV